MTSPLSGDAARTASLSNWFAELKRRRVFRALIGYGIASFAVLQVIEPVMHGLHWPETVLSYVVVALAAGFPVVITLAWVFDVKAGRIERTAPTEGLRGVPLAILLAATGVLAAAPGMFFYFVLRGGARGVSAKTSDLSAKTNGPDNAASIAILPFASLSSGEENAYFAEGFHDELLRQMGRIGSLQVISRTSVMQYKSAARNSREIAEALGVSSIVEGSVQRAGNRVRVEARLIDARNDRQLWGDRYDRDVTDIFAIQTALAGEIASALHARLSPAQKAQIENKPTKSAEAYDLYLRGLEYANRGAQPDNFAIAERFYRQAIQLDPSFALARAQLASAKIRMYWSAVGTPDSVVREATEEAEQALRIQPDLAEAHIALGLCHYFGHLDYEQALKEFELARPGQPDEASNWIGAIQRRQGKFDEAIRNFEQAARLDPRIKSYNLAETLILVRRYEEADQLLDQRLARAPDSITVMTKAWVQEAWKGDTQLAKKVLREIRARLDPEGRVGLSELFFVHILRHNPREALAFLDWSPADTVSGGLAIWPKVFLYALAHEALDEPTRAREEYQAAVPLLESLVNKSPERVFERTLLARAYAGLGRKEDALREARNAVEQLPISKDALYGSNIEIERAAVEARVGETDAAIEHIRYLLSIPCWLSPGLLRVDPSWAPLRNDPRFRKLAELDH
jgi:serine/threonine-protein kinase